MLNFKRFVYFGVIPGLLFQFIGSLLYFVIYPESDFTVTFYGFTKMLLFVWPVMWIDYSVYKKFNIQYKKSAIIGLISGLLIAGLIFVIYKLYEPSFANFGDNFKQSAKNFNIMGSYVAFSVFVCIIHSLLEEYYWRWFIFGGLIRTMNAMDAGIISSLGFGLHHIVVLSQFFPFAIAMWMTVGVMIGGGIWCWISRKTNTILGAWISHALVDGIIMYIGYTLIF